MNKNAQEAIEQGAKERRRGYRGWHLKRTKSEKTDTHQDQKEEKELTKELSYRSQEGKKNVSQRSRCGQTLQVEF